MSPEKSEAPNTCRTDLLDDRRPLHLQIASILRKRFQELEPDSQLPTVRALASEFDVSVGTIAKAIGLLELEGTIRKRQGKGVFVGPQGEANGRSTSSAPAHTIGVLIKCRDCRGSREHSRSSG